MTDKELRKLSRTELLEMLLEQTREVERLSEELESLREELESKKIAIENCGSIAEASLKLSGVFEAAQSAADRYVENVINKDMTALQIEKAAEERAEKLIKEAEEKCRELEERTAENCCVLLKEAEKKAKAASKQTYSEFDPDESGIIWN